MKNCMNCGAPLHGNKCEYCGTEYNSDNNVIADFSESELYGTLIIKGQEFQVCLGNVEINSYFASTGRLKDGSLEMCKLARKRKFTLIER